MANTFLQCTVVTPEKQVLDEKAFNVVLPAHDGLMGILSGHAPMLVNLGVGLLRYHDSDNNPKELFIGCGFGHVRNNEVTILTREAVLPDQISASDAQEAYHQAQEMPKASSEQVEARNLALMRARNLIKLAR